MTYKTYSYGPTSQAPYLPHRSFYYVMLGEHQVAGPYFSEAEVRHEIVKLTGQKIIQKHHKTLERLSK